MEHVHLHPIVRFAGSPRADVIPAVDPSEIRRTLTTYPPAVQPHLARVIDGSADSAVIEISDGGWLALTWCDGLDCEATVLAVLDEAEQLTSGDSIGYPPGHHLAAVARSMAETVLVHFRAGHYDDGANALFPLLEGTGQEGVFTAMLAWADHWIAAQPPDVVPAGADHVPVIDGPPTSNPLVKTTMQWAGRFIAARASGDNQALRDLIAEIPRDTSLWHVTSVAWAAARTDARMVTLN
jgi:hypothetical protein